MLDFAIYEEHLPEGDQPGGFKGQTLGKNAPIDWTPRMLNSTLLQQTQSVRREGHHLILKPGTYHVYGSAPAFGVERHRVRLRDEGSNKILLWGSGAHAQVGGKPIQTRSFLDGILAVAELTRVVIEHRAAELVIDPDSDETMGSPISMGPEVYATIRIERIDS